MRNNQILDFIVAFCIFSGCENPSSPNKKDPVDPPPTTSCDEPKTTNDYTWRIDTVGHWPSDLGGVYAFSDSDAYALGDIWDGKEVYAGLHWDGKKWGKITSGTGDDIGHSSLAISGDQNLMVSVGYAGVANPTPVLAEFDNRTKKWKATKFSGFGAVTSIWTDGTGLFLAGGSYGKLYRKNGYSSSWVTLSCPFDGQIDGIKLLSNGELYISQYNNSSQYQFWRQKNGVWQKIYDSSQPDSTRYIQFGFDELWGFDMFYCPVTKILAMYTFTTRNKTLVYKPEYDRFFGTENSYEQALGSLGHKAKVFAPNDIWFWGGAWFHWDGKTTQRFKFPGYPSFVTGTVPSKTKTGKVFIPLNNEGQVWLIAQGVPNF